MKLVNVDSKDPDIGQRVVDGKKLRFNGDE